MHHLKINAARATWLTVSWPLTLVHAPLLPYALATLLAAVLIGIGPMQYSPAARAAAPSVHSSRHVAARPACGGWSVIPSANEGSSYDGLSGVTAISPSDIWAVEDYFNANNVPQTLIEQWNGTDWSVVPSPNFGSRTNVLLAVSADAANDVWAVGYYVNAGGVPRALIEHFDGSSWSLSASVNSGSSTNALYGVLAIAANNVWAVGYHLNNSGIPYALLEHFDGSAWSIVPSPNAGSAANQLYSVSADAANDIWAVGSITSTSNIQQTLIEHFDGTTWSIVPSPNAGSSTNLLYGVSADATNDAWAVGYFVPGSGSTQTLIEHWNGTSWSIVPSPNPSPALNYLYGVVATSPGKAWAVGSVFNPAMAPSQQTLTEQWNGTSWNIVPSPSVGGASLLYGVTVDPANDVWAVGYEVANTGFTQTLVEEYC